MSKKLHGWNKTGILAAMKLVKALGAKAKFGLDKDYVTCKPGLKGLTLAYRRELPSGEFYKKFARLRLTDTITDEVVDSLTGEYNAIHFDIEKGKKYVVTKSKKLTLLDAIQKYLDEHSLKASTIRTSWNATMNGAYISKDWLEADIKDFGTVIQRTDIVSWFNVLTKDRGKSSANKARKNLSAVLNANGIDSRDLLKGLMHKLKGQLRVIDFEVIGDWYRAAEAGFDHPTRGNAYRAALALLITPFRIEEELLGLTWEPSDTNGYIDLKRKVIVLPASVTKNGEYFEMPADEILSIIDTDKKEGRLFETSAWTVRQVFTELCQRVNSARITPHDVRNCFASFGMNDCGLPKPIVDVILQHAVDSRDVTGTNYFSLDLRGKRRALRKWHGWLSAQAYPEAKETEAVFTPSDLEYFMSHLDTDEAKAKFAKITGADLVAMAAALAA